MEITSELERDICKSADELADIEADKHISLTHFIFKEGFVKGFMRGVDFVLCKLKLAETDEELIKGKAYVFTGKHKTDD